MQETLSGLEKHFNMLMSKESSEGAFPSSFAGHIFSITLRTKKLLCWHCFSAGHSCKVDLKNQHLFIFFQIAILILDLFSTCFPVWPKRDWQCLSQGCKIFHIDLVDKKSVSKCFHKGWELNWSCTQGR